MFPSRLSRLFDAIDQSRFAGVALNPSPTLGYFTGLHFLLMERPVVAFFSPGRPITLVLPELEAAGAADTELDIRLFPYGEDPNTWSGAFLGAVQEAGLTAMRIGVEPRWIRMLELQYLESAAPEAAFEDAGAVVEALRITKDVDELSLMQEAVRIAEQALRATLADVRQGISERRLAAALVQNLLGEGSDANLPFQPIVAFGENTANPHAIPTDRELSDGELVLFDWGANYRGYFSDLTRMFSLGEPATEAREIVSIVETANAAARAAAKPSLPAQTIDEAARGTIENAGYGPMFTHRTGHGIGLEVHEPPYIRSDNARSLVAGMTFTIEPGIYLPGRFGARIEDDMVVEQTSARSLSTMERSLIIL